MSRHKLAAGTTTRSGDFSVGSFLSFVRSLSHSSRAVDECSARQRAQERSEAISECAVRETGDAR